MPIARHYLKLYREKIAYYLTLKSLTENSYFDILLHEYTKIVIPQKEYIASVDENGEVEAQRDFLETLIKKAQEELDKDQES